MNTVLVCLIVLNLQLGTDTAPESDEAQPDVEIVEALADAETAGEVSGDVGIGPPVRDILPAPVSVEGSRPIPRREAPTAVTVEATSGKPTSWQAAMAPEHWATWSLFVAVLAAACGAFWLVMLLGRQIRVASSARLYIDQIRFTGLVAGSRPVFFVRIRNAGPADAHNVTVTIGAVYQGGGGREGAPQTMTIPANGSREFFVRWQAALTTAVRDDIRMGTSKLCVRVTTQHGEREAEQSCFQYYPWADSDRPEGLPDFVPCEVDSQLVAG